MEIETSLIRSICLRNQSGVKKIKKDGIEKNSQLRLFCADVSENNYFFTKIRPPLEGTTILFPFRASPVTKSVKV